MEKQTFATHGGTSDYREASAIIHRGFCKINGIILTGGSDNATLTVYDGVDDTGDKKTKLACPANNSKGFRFPSYLTCWSGIYCVLTGTAPIYTISYEVGKYTGSG